MTHIRRFSRVVADLARAEAFYAAALGFQCAARGPADAAALHALGADDTDAVEVVMQLGSGEIALVHFARPGRAYPPGSRSDDLWFQHLAIVVDDLDAAYRHLCAIDGWEPISRGGPQTLPASDGGVRAFKFRDPDRHPLELLWFPPGAKRQLRHAPTPARDAAHGGPFRGIAHSALAVAATRRSEVFYRGLGLCVSGRSRNRGAAQSRLDGLEKARLVVTALRPDAHAGEAPGPGLELLAYRPAGRRAQSADLRDELIDWVTFAESPAASRQPRGLADPDGHRLLLDAQCRASTGSPAAAPIT
jgi:catechol 2,3-dioxygenase-like lactoylglutathione lyase family enzyme